MIKILNNLDFVISMHSAITIGGLVNKHDSKVSFKSTNNRKYEFKNVIFSFTNLSFKDYLINLLNESCLIKNQKIGIITQFRHEHGGLYTIGSRYPLLITESPFENEQLVKYSDLLSSKFQLLDNWYKDINITEVIFNYTIISDQDYDRMLSKTQINTTDIIKEDQFLNVEHLFDLPLDMVYKGWGNTHQIIDGSTYRVNEIHNSSANKYIEITKVNNNNYIVKIFVNDALLATLRDSQISSQEFIRYTETKVYYVKDGKVYYHFDSNNKLKNISILRSMKNLELNIVTLDIETYLDENKTMKIYCVCFYDGKYSKSYYLSDFADINQMLNTLFSELLRRKYASKSIFIHNSSNFDMVFLLKHLVNMDHIKVRPLIKEGKFINLEIIYGENYQYRIYFKDSLLLLPVSLVKLAKQLDVEQQKLDFDHNIINSSNYIEFKDKAIEYCIADCVALYQVLNKFNAQIYELFKINISESSTLPSLAFRIFRTNFLTKNKIPIISNKLFDDMSNAYYGGHVDMYIPELKQGKILYHYDVNSLYPSVMKNYKYPSKLIGYFIGNINNMLEYKSINPLINEKYVGVFKVKVNAPSLLHPVLPHKVNNTTIFGQGSWTGWYYTSEIINAIKYGYTFEILAGYIFESADLFSKYVDAMYQMKSESPKDSPNYLISKLLMNSLYGRFGMAPIKSSHYIVDGKYLDAIIEEKGIENVNEIVNLNNKTMMTVNDQFVSEVYTNIAVALGVSANARVDMSLFKNNPELTGNLYYSDTDSIFIDKELPESLVDNTRLGAMKLEHILSQFIALGPKVYGGKTEKFEEFTKVKGFKENVPLSALKLLLFNGSPLELRQTKWLRSLVNATINLREDPYDLKPNNNKRELVYKNSKLVGTTNKIIDE